MTEQHSFQCRKSVVCLQNNTLSYGTGQSNPGDGDQLQRAYLSKEHLDPTLQEKPLAADAIHQNDGSPSAYATEHQSLKNAASPPYIQHVNYTCVSKEAVQG
jgi:hypothetical protein